MNQAIILLNLLFPPANWQENISAEISESIKWCVLTFIVYTCWTYFNGLFFFLPAIHFSRSFSLSRIDMLDLQSHAMCADNSTIYKYFQLLSYSIGIAIPLRIFSFFFLSFFRQFLSSLVFPVFSFAFERIDDEIFSVHFGHDSFLALIYYFVMWVELHWITGMTKREWKLIRGCDFVDNNVEIEIVL